MSALDFAVTVVIKILDHFPCNKDWDALTNAVIAEVDRLQSTERGHRHLLTLLRNNDIGVVRSMQGITGLSFPPKESRRKGGAR
jgi:hypothetical protein